MPSQTVKKVKIGHRASRTPTNKPFAFQFLTAKNYGDISAKIIQIIDGVSITNGSIIDISTFDV